MNAIVRGISLFRPLWNPVREDAHNTKREPTHPPYPNDAWSCWSVGDELAEQGDHRISGLWIEVASRF